jgi:GDP-4-dehydro-6-deoxy-D-mannose reductase
MMATTSQPTILITGGTGFAGSHLVEHLQSVGYRDIHVTTIGAKTDAHGSNGLESHQIHTLNLLDRPAVQELLQTLQPDYIYHLAAMAEVGSSFSAAEKTILNNTVIQLNMLEAVRECSAQSRLLIIGTGQEYDVLSPSFKADPKPLSEESPLGPSNPYAVSKVAQDLLGLAYYYSYQLNLVRVRPFNHIGERQSPQFAISHFAKQIAEAETGKSTSIKVGNLTAIRDFTDVKDIVKAYRLVIEEGQVGQVYNIGSGQGYSMQELLDQLIDQAKVGISVETDPTMFRPVDMPVIIADNTKIKSLGWEPSIPMADTLKRVLEYWREHP